MCFNTFSVLKSIASRSTSNLKLYMMVINSAISRWIRLFINQEMKPASPVTEVTFNPDTPNLGLFQIYGSEDRYKTLPGPFYRLLGLFHLILLFPNTVLFVRAGFVRAVTRQFFSQENVALHRRNRVAHPNRPWQDSQVRGLSPQSLD